MRDLKDFSAREWIRLQPVQLAFKQIRNDLLLAIYNNCRPKALDLFLKETERFKDKNIALVVAFEQPWAVDWLLRMAKHHISDTTILVFDNSRRKDVRQEIEQVCRDHQTPYLALPTNLTRHPNRSHGMAMTWIFYNVVRAIKPRLFAFIDHDLIPVQKIEFAERLGEQACFGLDRRVSSWAWNLWAGYCMYDFSRVSKLKMNFLYDFSRGLDTGGRNWNILYNKLDHARLRLASNRVADVRDPVTGENKSVQFIDERWIHIGAISHKNNYKPQLQFYNNLISTLDRGISWSQICDPADTHLTKHS